MEFILIEVKQPLSKCSKVVDGRSMAVPNHPNIPLLKFSVLYIIGIEKVVASVLASY
jgi:hypothetical protein